MTTRLGARACSAASAPWFLEVDKTATGLERATGFRADAGYASRVNSITQFVSQVSPPSFENACSQRGLGVSMRDHR